MMDDIDFDHLEIFDYIRLKVIRVVKHPRRAKRLRDRGEDVRWSKLVGGWVWHAEKLI